MTATDGQTHELGLLLQLQGKAELPASFQLAPGLGGPQAAQAIAQAAHSNEQYVGTFGD